MTSPSRYPADADFLRRFLKLTNCHLFFADGRPVRNGGGRLIKDVLVDDEELVRSGLRMILRNAEDIDVVGEAGEGVEAVGVVRELEPDVVLLDTGCRAWTD